MTGKKCHMHFYNQLMGELQTRLLFNMFRKHSFDKFFNEKYFKNLSETNLKRIAKRLSIP